MTIVMTTNKRAHRHEINWNTDKKETRRDDHKGNLHHHATKRREGYKRQREEIEIDYIVMAEGITWNFDFRDLFEDAA